MINEFKADFCMNLYEKALYFDEEQLINYVTYLKQSMNMVQNLRQSYYCSLCDGQE